MPVCNKTTMLIIVFKFFIKPIIAVNCMYSETCMFHMESLSLSLMYIWFDNTMTGCLYYALAIDCKSVLGCLLNFRSSRHTACKVSYTYYQCNLLIVSFVVCM